MRLQSQAEGRKQRVREQSKSGAIRFVFAVGNATSVAGRGQNKARAVLLGLFVQLVMRLQSQAEGRKQRVREQSKSGAIRFVFAVGNATSVAGRGQKTEQSNSGAIRFVCAVGNATSVASKQRAEQCY